MTGWAPLLVCAADKLSMATCVHPTKAVPGRKTDVKDSEWIAQLLSYGLLRGSFVPERPQRELRE